MSRFEQYFAIGSGAEYSLGALHRTFGDAADAADVARKAVETAITFNVHCGGPVESLRL